MQFLWYKLHNSKQNFIHVGNKSSKENCSFHPVDSTQRTFHNQNGQCGDLTRSYLLLFVIFSDRKKNPKTFGLYYFIVCLKSF